MSAKVYILDDDLVHAKLVAANLGPGRFRTRVFDRADALLAHHAEEPADAVITDLVMPDLDGVEVTRRLRTGDRHLPIFVLTGHADVATAIEALKAGATEYLTKDRKSTRLNSSHGYISYAVFCLKKKKSN